VASAAITPVLIGRFRGQHRQPARRGKQAFQCLDGDQGHVGIQHQHLRAIGHVRHRLLHGVAGAELPRLFGPVQAGIPGERSAHLFTAMAMDHVDAGRRQRPCDVEHVREHRPSGDLLQHLGLRRFHALAFTGGKDDHMKRCDVRGVGHGGSCCGMAKF
jgi:hypothetical protein